MAIRNAGLLAGLLGVAPMPTITGKRFGEPTPPPAAPCEAQEVDGNPVSRCPFWDRCSQDKLSCEAFRKYVTNSNSKIFVGGKMERKPGKPRTPRPPKLRARDYEAKREQYLVYRDLYPLIRKHHEAEMEAYEKRFHAWLISLRDSRVRPLK
jgi:hypothetical protein